jgi:hypothetical protein
VEPDRAGWLLYVVGWLLVLGTWVRLVPTSLGLIGWLMAWAGWAIRARRRAANESRITMLRAEQIDRLYALRHRNVISDEEFQKEKRRLLDQPS